MSALTIGQLAKQASVKSTTVRYYERRGLLLAPSRSVAGYRLYPDESVRRLRFIKHAQDLGFTLNEINDLLELTAMKLNVCFQQMQMATPLILGDEQRLALVHKGKRLQYFTIVWNSLEAIVAIVSGLIAGSISLVGFGFDSLIEVTSAAAVLWRMHLDHPERREHAERVSLRIVGGCFIALAIYLAVDSIKSLYQHEKPEHSLPGIVLAIVSLIVMPVLSRSKRRVGRQLSSGAMQADATQTEFCTYLSAILLFGLTANWLLGWWWADPAAALLMAPLIAREGWEAFNARVCC
jgi:DNA-binding transcriptional MerR regulator